MKETEHFIFEDENERPILDKLDVIRFYVCEFFKNWIYPAYYLKNILFRRYDRVKMPSIRPWEYSDTCERLKCAVFELVCEFVDLEERHQTVQWYGEYGHKVDGEYVMDIAKDIRDWWRRRRALEEAKYYDFQTFYCKWVIGKMRFCKADDETGYGRVVFDESELPKSVEDYLKTVPEDEWRMFDAVCDDRSKIMDKNYMRDLCNKLELGLDDEDDKYLHKAISIRQSLWT